MMMRDSMKERPLRWLAYAYVLGRSMPILPLQYCRYMTMGYVAVDTLRQVGSARGGSVVMRPADTLIWHGLASVYIPGVMCKYVADNSHKLVKSFEVGPPRSIYIPFGFVMAALALGGVVIDGVVDTVLNNTTRPIMMGWR